MISNRQRHSILLFITMGALAIFRLAWSQTGAVTAAPPLLSSPSGATSSDSSASGVSAPALPTPAVSSTPTVATKSPGPPERETTLTQDLIEKNRDISLWFDQLADSVDVFLVGHRVTTKPNRSRIVVENTTYSRESRNFANLTNISINPAFPNLEKYWNLKFTTYDDTDVNKERTDRGYARPTPRQNYAATVGFFRRFKDVRLSYEPRIEFRGAPALSHFLTADTVADYKWANFNPRLRFFATAYDGTGISQDLNFKFNINEKFSFTWLNQAEYEDRYTLFTVTNGFSLSQAITDRSGLAYGISFYSNNKDVYHLDAYSVSVTWSEVIYRNILDYQLSPHVDFVNDEHFKGYVGLIFGLRVYF